MKYIKAAFFIVVAFAGALQADKTSYFNIDDDNSHHLEITLPEEFQLSLCKMHNDIHIDHVNFPEKGMILIHKKKPGENLVEDMNQHLKSEIADPSVIEYLGSANNLFTKLHDSIASRTVFLQKEKQSAAFFCTDTESYFCFIGLVFNGDLKELQEIAQVVASGINLVPNK